jgi:hypothetical protein
MSPESEMGSEENHFRRIVIIWVVLSVALDLLFWFLVGPHVPPGRMTSTAKDNQFDFNVLMVIGLPVAAGCDWRVGVAGLRRCQMERETQGHA